MSFNEKVEELGYTIRDWTKEKVSIIRQGRTARIVIVFDIKNKKILGYVQQTDLVMDIEDMSNYYKIFNVMKQDLKVFADMAEYDIIK